MIRATMPSDLPLQQALAKAEEVISRHTALGQKAEVYFKFTCQHCGSRQTFDKPNTIHTSGICEACGLLTDPITGYGMMLVSSPGEVKHGH